MNKLLIILPIIIVITIIFVIIIFDVPHTPVSSVNSVTTKDGVTSTILGLQDRYSQCDDVNMTFIISPWKPKDEPLYLYLELQHVVPDIRDNLHPKNQWKTVRSNLPVGEETYWKMPAGWLNFYINDATWEVTSLYYTNVTSGLESDIGTDPGTIIPIPDKNNQLYNKIQFVKYYNFWYGLWSCP